MHFSKVILMALKTSSLFLKTAGCHTTWMSITLGKPKQPLLFFLFFKISFITIELTHDTI